MKRSGFAPRKTRLRSVSAKQAKSLSPAPTPRAWINRTTGVKRKPRKASETERIYGSPERRAWIKSLPCLVCVSVSPVFALVRGRSENAHTVTGGTGRKADAETIVPLCRSHHRCYDEHRYPCDDDAVREKIKAAAATYAAAWLARAAHSHMGTME